MNAHKLPYGQLEALENFNRAFGVSVPLFTYPLLPEAHKKPTSLSSKALAPVRQCELQTHNTEKPKQISSSGLSKKEWSNSRNFTITTAAVFRKCA